VRELLRQRRQTENPIDAIPEGWKRILAYVEERQEPVTAQQVGEGLGLSDKVRHTLRRMAEAGLLRRVELGVYEVA
jgi:predicted transcriptional regulator of viral defense system